MDRLLGIYLNDHLALLTGAIELARRSEKRNEGTELGSFLAKVRECLRADRVALQELMRQGGFSRDPIKLGVAWLSEKAGRLKLNGQLTGYSPLSCLVELEGLDMLIQSVRGFWQTLYDLGPRYYLLQGRDLGPALHRWEELQPELQRWRTKVAASAFARAA